MEAEDTLPGAIAGMGPLPSPGVETGAPGTDEPGTGHADADGSAGT
jgi:hypothetical protein